MKNASNANDSYFKKKKEKRKRFTTSGRIILLDYVYVYIKLEGGQ